MDSEETSDIFRLVGTTVAAAQIFEITFVLASKLVLKQSNVETLEEIEPIVQSKTFKQPTKALLNELSQAQIIPEHLEDRVSALIENRHRIIHRAFLEFGWPGSLSEEKTEQFRDLCINVSTESQELSVIFTSMVLTWMKRFPAMSETSEKYEERFSNLAKTIHEQWVKGNVA